MNLINLFIIGIINFVVVYFFNLTGGIGMVIRPLLIFFGIPPQIAIGTSRVSAIVGNIISLKILNKSKKIDWKLVFKLSPIFISGWLFGIFIITSINDYYLNKIIGILLIIIVIFIIIKKDIGIAKWKPILGKYHLLISWPLMFISGSLLVIAGWIWPLNRILLILGYGKTYIESAAIQKAINFSQTIVTTIVFIFMFFIDWKVLITLIISSGIGTYFGTKFALKKGNKFLQYILIIVIFISAIKLIFFT